MQNWWYFTWPEHGFQHNPKLFSILVQSNIANNNTKIEPNSCPCFTLPNCIYQDSTHLKFFVGHLFFSTPDHVQFLMFQWSACVCPARFPHLTLLSQQLTRVPLPLLRLFEVFQYICIFSLMSFRIFYFHLVFFCSTFPSFSFLFSLFSIILHCV